MRLPLGTRIAGTVMAVFVATASPTLAVSHGYAHHELLAGIEHGGGLHDVHAHDHNAAGESSRAFTAVGLDGSGDHDHPQLSPAALSRGDLQSFVEAAACVAPEPGLLFLDDACAFLLAPDARASPPFPGPGQPRAPPAA